MSITHARAPHAASHVPDPLGPAAGRIVRDRPLPRGRALLGGFLVAVAVVAVFAAYRRAQAPPTTSYAVLSVDLAPGERLGSEDLRMQALDLPPELAEVSYTDPTAAVGGVATHQLLAGQLLARSDVRESAGYVAGGEVALALDRADALAGSLQPGERVDVLATYGTGDAARTVAVVRDALVVAVGGGGGLAGDATVVVRLGVAGGDEALAVTNAADVAQTSLARVDGGPTSLEAISPPLAGAPAGAPPATDAGQGG